MSFCVNVPIETIAGSECIGDSLVKINRNFATLGEASCELLSSLNALSAFPVQTTSSDNIQLTYTQGILVAYLKSGSVDLSQLSFDGGSLAFRNKIINGDMLFSQRFGSNAILINETPTYVVDRWYGFGTNEATFSMQQATSDGLLGLKSTVTQNRSIITSNDSFGFAQKIEGAQLRNFRWGTSQAQSVTLSFWSKCSTLNTEYGGSVTNHTGTRSFVFSFQNTTTQWEKQTIVIPGDTEGSWNIHNNQTGLILYFSLGEGTVGRGQAGVWTNGNFKTPIGIDFQPILVGGSSLQITQVQLEQGDFSTPFETRPFEVEFNACKRYFEKSYLYDITPGTSTQTNCHVHTSATVGTNMLNYVIAPYTVEKRDIPNNLKAYSTDGTSNAIFSNNGNKQVISSADQKNTKFALFKTASPNIDLGTGINYLYHWAVDAEL